MGNNFKMAIMRSIWHSGCALIRSIYRTIVAVPFTLRWLIIPFAIVGSVMLSFGSELLLRIFGTDKLGVWSDRQSAGVLFVISAILTYGIVVMIELFEQFRLTKSDSDAGLDIRITLFYDVHWRWRRRVAIAMFVMTLVVVVFAFLVLFSSYSDMNLHAIKQAIEIGN